MSEEGIKEIIRVNTHIREFWGDGAAGWAPSSATELLSKSRLDRQVELSRALRNWLGPFDPNEEDAQLILAWANLGSLVEGTMKWFLCVYAEDYAKDRIRMVSGKELEPDELFFVRLCGFFREKIFTASDPEGWADWMTLVRQRRNAIHAYQDREIGTFEEFWLSVARYRDFLLDLEGRVPYPDFFYGYPG